MEDYNKDETVQFCYSDRLSNEEEKKNHKFILNYKKKHTSLVQAFLQTASVHHKTTV